MSKPRYIGTGSRGRLLENKSLHYSDDHRYILAFCAKKANIRLMSEGFPRVDTKELMAEGWWRVLRRCTKDSLRPAITNTIRQMAFYGRSLCTQGHLQRTDIDATVWELLPGKAERWTGWQEEARRLLCAVPAEHRALVAMRVVGGRTFAEMSQRYGVPYQTLQHRYRRAIEQARERLQERETFTEH